ncbi:MAG: apolipoprotein N-acyltransferase [Micavibrio sp.]|nr:MAG: apolipoprotein N-acyltransferase [Micavibrio sp.]
MDIKAIRNGSHSFLPRMAECLVLGAISAASMAPMNYWFALFFGLGLFYIALSQSTSPLRSFTMGWAFGAGYFIASMSWIGNALLIDGNPYLWAWPLAVVGFQGALAFFPAFACLAIHYVCKLKTLGGFLGFVGLLALSEWLRGHIFTGFPWNLYAYGWVNILPIVQVVSFSNAYFLNLLTIFWMTLPGFLYLSEQTRKNKTVIATLTLASFAACYGYGSWRLHSHETTYNEDISLHIVQPNIAQADKWNRKKMVNHYYKHLGLSQPGSTEAKTTYIIWPETTLSEWFLNDRSSLLGLQNTLASYPGEAYLMSGVLRRVNEPKSYFNSFLMIDKQGEILQSYDKSHLVPFGEYMPYQKWIPFGPVSKFTGLKPGDGIQSFETPEGLRYTPLICYEIIFPGQTINRQQKRPDIMINVTNDSWYGISGGPYQHFNHAIFRAAEEGIPVARSANTGFSGLIDPLGRILYKSSLFKESSKSLLLPKKL